MRKKKPAPDPLRAKPSQIVRLPGDQSVAVTENGIARLGCEGQTKYREHRFTIVDSRAMTPDELDQVVAHANYRQQIKVFGAISAPPGCTINHNPAYAGRWISAVKYERDGLHIGCYRVPYPTLAKIKAMSDKVQARLAKARIPKRRKSSRS